MSWRAGLVTVALLAFVIGSSPSASHASLCGNLIAGEVVFIGKVYDAPDGMFVGSPGIYTFEVSEVIRGDPADGRVYTGQGFGGSGKTFRLGSTYLVHAEVADPPDGARLTTSACMMGKELAPSPALSILGLPFGTVLPIVGAGIASIGFIAWRRGRRAD